MDGAPSIVIITPTWARHDMLLDRCVPSVQAQRYGGPVVHVIVSDGPDDELAAALRPFADARVPVLYAEMTEPAHCWGARVRRAALGLWDSEFVTYIDDDDALRPDHCALLAEALAGAPDAGFAYSMMVQHRATDIVLGANPPMYGHMGTPMVMHRRGLPGGWGEPSAKEDWDLVQGWLAAGVRWVHVPQITVDVWPSIDR